MDALMRRLVDYETTPDGGGDGGAAPPEPTPAATPPEPASWQGPSQQEWEQAQQALQQLGSVAPFMQELQQILSEDPGAQQQGGELQIDPQVQQYLDAQVERMYQERFGAFEPVLGQIAEREGEQIARSELDRLAGEGGEFNRDLALVAAQQYVGSGMSPDQALVAAAEYARTMQKQIADEAIKAHQEALLAAAGAPPEPGPTGAAVTQPPVPTGRDRYEETLSRFRSSMNPVIGGTQ